MPGGRFDEKRSEEEDARHSVTDAAAVRRTSPLLRNHAHVGEFLHECMHTSFS